MDFRKLFKVIVIFLSIIADPFVFAMEEMNVLAPDHKSVLIRKHEAPPGDGETSLSPSDSSSMISGGVVDLTDAGDVEINKVNKLVEDLSNLTVQSTQEVTEVIQQPVAPGTPEKKPRSEKLPGSAFRSSTHYSSVRDFVRHVIIACLKSYDVQVDTFVAIQEMIQFLFEIDIDQDDILARYVKPITREYKAACRKISEKLWGAQSDYIQVLDGIFNDDFITNLQQQILQTFTNKNQQEELTVKSPEYKDISDWLIGSQKQDGLWNKISKYKVSGQRTSASDSLVFLLVEYYFHIAGRSALSEQSLTKAVVQFDMFPIKSMKSLDKKESLIDHIELWFRDIHADDVIRFAKVAGTFDDIMRNLFRAIEKLNKTYSNVVDASIEVDIQTDAKAITQQVNRLYSALNNVFNKVTTPNVPERDKKDMRDKKAMYDTLQDSLKYMVLETYPTKVDILKTRNGPTNGTYFQLVEIILVQRIHEKLVRLGLKLASLLGIKPTDCVFSKCIIVNDDHIKRLTKEGGQPQGGHLDSPLKKAILPSSGDIKGDYSRAFCAPAVLCRNDRTGVMAVNWVIESEVQQERIDRARKLIQDSENTIEKKKRDLNKVIEKNKPEPDIAKAEDALRKSEQLRIDRIKTLKELESKIEGKASTLFPKNYIGNFWQYLATIIHTIDSSQPREDIQVFQQSGDVGTYYVLHNACLGVNADDCSNELHAQRILIEAHIEDRSEQGVTVRAMKSCYPCGVFLWEWDKIAAEHSYIAATFGSDKVSPLLAISDAFNTQKDSLYVFEQKKDSKRNNYYFISVKVLMERQGIAPKPYDEFILLMVPKPIDTDSMDIVTP
jgi:hypothetical protein